MNIYKYDISTKEFMYSFVVGKAYGTALPFSTIVEPLTYKDGYAVVFNGNSWDYVEDNRKSFVYNKETKEETVVEYLGKIKDGFTKIKPSQFDIWDYETGNWIIDISEKNKYELNIKISEAKTYLAETDWVEPYLIKHYTGLSILEEDSNKFVIEAKREEARAFLKEQGL